MFLKIQKLILIHINNLYADLEILFNINPMTVFINKKNINNIINLTAKMNISENCFICKKQSDQMLMLSCVHDPCINCAASAFA